MKRKASELSDSSDPILLALISQFLANHGFSSTLRIFTTERRKRLSSSKAQSTYGEHETAGIPQLDEILSTFLKTRPPPARPKSRAMSSSGNESSSSSDSDSSSSDSDSDSDGDVKMEDGSDSDADSSASTTSDSEQSSKAAHPASQPSRKRKASASSSSSDNSSSDSSSSDSEGDQPPAKKPRVTAKDKPASSSSESSTSESDTSSDESDDEDSAAQVVAQDLNDAVNTPLPPSDSSSSDDSEDSDSSSSDESDGESKSGNQDRLAPSVTAIKTVTTVEENSDSSGTVVGDLLTTGQPNPRQTKHQGAHPTRLAMLSAAADMDDYISNTYVSYDYADRAYKDLSVTRGKGFTKEKNKKKRGSYRGGTIDTAGGKAFKFDD